MQSPNTHYIERLDHLRFFAAALVVIFHTGYQLRGPAQFLRSDFPLFEQGHVGVQIFMAISGFILGVISHGKQVDAGRFYFNRLLRIYPLFTVIILLGYSAGNLTSSRNVSDLLIALLPVSNISRLNYGEFGDQLWSIAIELQFYLLFPVLLRMQRLHGRAYLASLVLFLIILRTAVFLAHGTVHYMAYFTLFGSLDVFIAGHLLGSYYSSTPARRLSNPLWLAASVFALNVVIWLIFRDGHFFHVKSGAVENRNWVWIVWPDIAAALACFLIITYLWSSLQIPASAFLARLGKYSYSVYVWHGLVIAVVMRFSGKLTGTDHVYLVAFLVVLPVTLLLSAASYHVIEKPFLTWRVAYVVDGDGLMPESSSDEKVKDVSMHVGSTSHQTAAGS